MNQRCSDEQMKLSKLLSVVSDSISEFEKKTEQFQSELIEVDNNVWIMQKKQERGVGDLVEIPVFQ